MKYFKSIIIAFTLLVPSFAGAVVTSWDFTNSILQPLSSQRSAQVKASYFTASSTSATSTFPGLMFTNATGTAATSTDFFSTRGNFNTLCIALDCKTAWPGGSSSYDAWTHPVAGQSATTSQMLFNGGLTFSLATGTSATTTNFFADLFKGNALSIGGTATATISSIGSLSLPTGAFLTVTDLTSALTLTGAGGIFAEYTGSGACVNQFVRVLSALGVATCETVSLTADVTGDLPFANLAQVSANSVLGNITGSTADASSVATSSLFVWSGTGSVLRAISAALTTPSIAGSTLTGVHDAGGADSFELPNGTAPTVDATGETAVDTTSDQFVFYGASAKKVLGNGSLYPAFTYATSTTWTGTTTIPLGTAYVGETWNGVQCFTDAGTLGVSFYDGTNRMTPYIPTASTTVNINALTTNNTFTALEKRYVDVGTPASTPTKISCTVSKSLTAD